MGSLKVTTELMVETMNDLVDTFPDCAVILLVAPFNAPKGARTNYISNGKREDIVVYLKELVARFEGRVVPGTDQVQ
jgi:hypothetical protein